MNYKNDIISNTFNSDVYCFGCKTATEHNFQVISTCESSNDKAAYGECNVCERIEEYNTEIFDKNLNCFGCERGSGLECGDVYCSVNEQIVNGEWVCNCHEQVEID